MKIRQGVFLLTTLLITNQVLSDISAETCRRLDSKPHEQILKSHELILETKKGGDSNILPNILNFISTIAAPLPTGTQVYAIFRAKRAAGVSFTAFFWLSLNYAFTTGYNYHYGYNIGTWLNQVFSLFGNLVIMIQVWFYEGASSEKPDGVTKKDAITAFAIIIPFYAGFFLNIYPENIYSFALNSATVFYCWSKIKQISENIRLQSVGNLVMTGPLIRSITNTSMLYTTRFQAFD